MTLNASSGVKLFLFTQDWIFFMMAT